MDKKSEKLSKAVGGLSDDIIERADSERQRLLSKRKLAIRRMTIGISSAAACFVLAVGVFATVSKARGAIDSTDPNGIHETLPTTSLPTYTQAIDNGATSPDGTLNYVITSGSFHTGTINSEAFTSPTGEFIEPAHTTVTGEETAPPPTTVTENTPEICSVPTAPTTSATTKASTKATTKATTTAPAKTTKPEKTTPPTTTIKHRDDIVIDAEPLCYVEYPETFERPNINDYRSPNGVIGYNDEYFEKVEEYNQKVRERRELAMDISEYSDFYMTSAREILGSADGDNMVYSPITLYEALSMLAEVTDGSTREEVLAVLNSPDIETQRERAQTLFVTNYSDKENDMVLPAASLWVNADYPYNEETIDSLALNYFAESYLFDGYDSKSSKRLQDWLNEKTKNMLQNAVRGVELRPDTILNICTTMYFKGQWMDEFHKEYTEEMTFYSPNGNITADFMYKLEQNGNLYLGSNYTAVINNFINGNDSMYFILPNEGESVDDVLASDEYLDFVFSNNPREDFDYYRAIVHQRIPKFDISSDVTLNKALKNLGIQEAFDGDGDFTSLISEDYPVYLDKVQHAARIKIDEKGCEAAAFVNLAFPGAAPPPPDEVYFTADRPFIIVIKSATNQPLFMGVVNNP